MTRPGGAPRDLEWICPKGFTLETVLPDGEGGLYLIGAIRTYRLAKGAKAPKLFCEQGSAAGAVCLDAKGSLILGHGKQVHRIARDGKATKLADGFDEVFGVAIDEKGRLYVSDWQRGEVWMVEGTERELLAKGLEYPSGLVLDRRGRLYIKESGRMTNRDMTVRRIDLESKERQVELFATVPSITRRYAPKPDPKKPEKKSDVKKSDVKKSDEKKSDEKKAGNENE